MILGPENQSFPLAPFSIKLAKVLTLERLNFELESVAVCWARYRRHTAQSKTLTTKFKSIKSKFEDDKLRWCVYQLSIVPYQPYLMSGSMLMSRY